MNSNKQYPRTFVPSHANMGDWAHIEPLFKSLVERKISSAQELEQWLLDQSELASCIFEERTRRYVAMTCHTDNPEHEKRFLDFLENIEPQCKPYWQQLNDKYLQSPQRKELPSERYQVLDRNVQAEVDIFEEENIPLQTESSKLSQQYQKICGAMTVEFEGKEHTLPQMAKYLEELDRDRRKQAWTTVTQRRLQEQDTFEDIFDQQIQIRDQIARNAGFPNYLEYAFLLFKRFDYSPQDGLSFHEAVEKWVVPLARKLAQERQQHLGVETLRPWDTAVDPLGRPPLRPFEQADELKTGVHTIYQRLDSRFSSWFQEMSANNELDLESRKGKAPGGYLTSFDEIRRPFIFMNASGVQRDVETLLHESGHAFHMLASKEEPLIEYRDAPLEFAEVASMSMELFGAKHLNVFYNQEDALRARRNHLEGIINILPWIARIDAFQHWLYTHPQHTREERIQTWLDLERRFSIELDWSGYERVQQYSWHRQLHLFCHPFYYIEYGIAQLGALQLWKRFRQQKEKTLQNYLNALSLGGSKPLPVLFTTAGAEFDFSERTIKPLMEDIQEELSHLALK